MILTSRRGSVRREPQPHTRAVVARGPRRRLITKPEQAEAAPPAPRPVASEVGCTATPGCGPLAPRDDGDAA
jgi:hypothetical protein